MLETQSTKNKICRSCFDFLHREITLAVESVTEMQAKMAIPVAVVDWPKREQTLSSTYHVGVTGHLSETSPSGQ